MVVFLFCAACGSDVGAPDINEQGNHEIGPDEMLHSGGHADYSIEYDVANIDMVWINGGHFLMGSVEKFPRELLSELPAHKVSIDGFWISKTEVTLSQYRAVVKDADQWNSSFAEFPALVHWTEADAFCRRISQLTATQLELPTEAEWEFACRAGTQTLYFFGDSKQELEKYAWYERNSALSIDESSGRPLHEIHPVAQKLPNPWGLYDILGNASEWCADWYSEEYYKISPSSNPRGPEHGDLKIVRGGSYIYSADDLRCAVRVAVNPDESLQGFRIVRRSR